jgi:5-methylcytosine-specific restriction protein A
MATYLLTWNPRSWDWKTLPKDSDDVKKGKGNVHGRWSCGNTKKISKGDRFFLLKQGIGDKTGLIGSGYFRTSPYVDVHWDDERAANNDEALYAKISFDTLLNPEKDRILLRKFLKSDRLFSKLNWDTQRSGIEIKEPIASELEKLWIQFSSGNEFILADEILGDYFEGAKRRITVNAYERDLDAREHCLEHYGNRCHVCGFDFDDFYGQELAQGYIHVHHLVPLSEIGKEYKVDPINDLRPVCPNCHAMIHRRKPAYTIDEIKRILGKRAKRGSIK